MANYAKLTNFAIKDTLLTGNPQKVVRGTEIDNEFEAIQTAVATKADLTSPAFLGSPTAPTPAVNSDSTLVATTAFVRDVVPAGIIVMWSGLASNIPAGWVLCDGGSGSPDLRNRFIVGAGGSYGVGAAGGSADATLVSHTHTASVTDPGHTHTVPQTVYIETGSGNFVGGSNGATPEGSINPVTTTATTGISVGISTVGSSASGANLPPYYALCYIFKT